MNKNIQTFISCNHDYKDANIVLSARAVDGTVFSSGCALCTLCNKKGFNQDRNNSPYRIRIWRRPCLTARFGATFGNTRAALDMIGDFAAKVISDGKYPLWWAGAPTLGSVKAAAKIPDLHIIHFDAHTDLRDDYMGESCYAVMRRCWEIVGDGRIFQFGIRSGERRNFYGVPACLHQ